MLDRGGRIGYMGGMMISLREISTYLQIAAGVLLLGTLASAPAFPSDSPSPVEMGRQLTESSLIEDNASRDLAIEKLISIETSPQNTNPAISYLKLLGSEGKFPALPEHLINALNGGIDAAAMLFSYTESLSESTEISVARKLTLEAFVKLRRRNPYAAGSHFPEQLQSGKLSSDDAISNPLLAAAKESAAQGSPIAIAVMRGLPDSFTGKKAEYCSAMSELVRVGHDKWCNGSFTASSLNNTPVEFEECVARVAASVSKHSIARYGAYCSFIRDDILLSREAICGDVISYLDLLCTVDMESNTNSAERMLPICPTRIEAAFVRALSKQYEVFLGSKIFSIRDK